MADLNFSEFITFKGEIKFNEIVASIIFKARIDNTGEVEINFDRIAINAETKFIEDNWQGNAKILGVFSLIGLSDGGMRIQSKNLSLMRLNTSWDNVSGRWMSPVASATQVSFFRQLNDKSDCPVLSFRLKGFRSFNQLMVDCELGTIVMNGSNGIDDPDLMLGKIAIHALVVPDNLDAWKARANKLLEHVRRVMSFASATALRAPVTEFFNDDLLELTAYSQTKQTSASMRVVHYLNQEDIFEAAVNSFFMPAIHVKNLFYAIEWFCMDSTYNEVRLVNAMTVLENLVASNLDDEEGLILPKRKFESTRKIIRKILRGTEELDLTDEIVTTLNARLSDINRRSILEKLDMLIQRWGVSTKGISKTQLEQAKRARDLIVHRGHYYSDNEEKSDALWDHVTVIRELIVRIIFTVIAYRGSYISFMGGMHDCKFAPEDNHTNIE